MRFCIWVQSSSFRILDQNLSVHRNEERFTAIVFNIVTRKGSRAFCCKNKNLLLILLEWDQLPSGGILWLSGLYEIPFSSILRHLQDSRLSLCVSFLLLRVLDIKDAMLDGSADRSKIEGFHYIEIPPKHYINSTEEFSFNYIQQLLIAFIWAIQTTTSPSVLLFKPLCSVSITATVWLLYFRLSMSAVKIAATTATTPKLTAM